MNNFIFLKTRLWQQQYFIMVALILLFAPHVYAYDGIEFLSISNHAVTMYDAPSLKAEKLYVTSRYLPVEAVVNVEGWVKVRDSSGILAWVEKKSLSKKRYVIVTVPQAEIYRSADTHSGLVFQAEKNVVMEWVDSANAGWVKVRHPDGQLGYIRVNQVWGI